MRTISAILAACLTERGAQKQLADDLGVEQSTISNWVNGRNEPTADRWADIEQALGLDRYTLAKAKGETDGPLPDTERATVERLVTQIRVTAENLAAGLDRLEGLELRLDNFESRLRAVEQTS